MLPKQRHAVSTAAGSINDYDNDIYNDLCICGPERDTEDEAAEYTTCYDRSEVHIQSCMYC